jgi:hypothetical protein
VQERVNKRNGKIIEGKMMVGNKRRGQKMKEEAMGLVCYLF